ncbi:MAG: hypothetical protein KJO44_00605, partial [Gemmatimonadetes bacterium]|nr:hypothetical protein [Gemmatimonadota bacterium]
MTRKTVTVMALAVLALAGVLYAQYAAGSNYNEPGGVRTVIQGSLDVVSGGDLDIESGGSFKIAGSALGSTAAELDKLDGIASTAYLEVCDGVSFTEDGSGTSYIGTVEIPAGAWLTDIKVTSTVLWDGTSAS